MSLPGAAVHPASRIRVLVRVAMLAAACAAVGYGLAAIPNVELISAAVFTCGALVGVRHGILVGLIAEAIFSGFNPNGVAPPPLFAAQLLGFGLIGAIGGATRTLWTRRSRLLRTLAAALCGFTLTLVYDVLTNFAVWLTVRESAALGAVMLGGLSFPFPLAHALGNTVGFAIVVPALVGAVRRRDAMTGTGAGAMLGVLAGVVCGTLALGGPAAAQIAPLAPTGGPRGFVLHRAQWLAMEPLDCEDLLRMLSGVAMARSGGLGSAELTNLAGSTNGRVQVVIDGVDISEPDYAWPRILPVQIGMLDSIEVVRTTDPARVSMWTRRGDSTAPQVDFDLGRGQLITRTRRVQMFTPERSVQGGVAYEELLRSGDDFRTGGLTVDTAPDLGEYSGRSVLVRIGLRRGADFVRVEHLEGIEESHGSVASQLDGIDSRSTRSALRWERPFGSLRAILDVGHTAWDRTTVVAGTQQDPRDARTHASLDLVLPAMGHWQNALRARHATTTGDLGVPEARHVAIQQERIEWETSRSGRLHFDAAAGANYDTRSEVAWNGRGAAWLERGPATLGLRAGRGVSWAGWNEQGIDTERIGIDGAVFATWQERQREWRFEVWGKDLRGGGSAAALVPGAGPGPTRIAGTLLEGTWHGVRGPWSWRTTGGGTWTPTMRGDRAGLATVQARLDLRAARSFDNGDLVVSLLSDWILDSERVFASGKVAASAWGSATLELQFLQRLDFFGGFRNLLDARIQTYPGVEIPDRIFWFGVRARVLD